MQHLEGNYHDLLIPRHNQQYHPGVVAFQQQLHHAAREGSSGADKTSTKPHKGFLEDHERLLPYANIQKIMQETLNPSKAANRV